MLTEIVALYGEGVTTLYVIATGVETGTTVAVEIVTEMPLEGTPTADGGITAEPGREGGAGTAGTPG